jgi:hypothetical protein
LSKERRNLSADTVQRALALARTLVRILGARSAPYTVSTITQSSVSLERLVQTAAGDPRYPACRADNIALLYEAGLAEGECRWDVRKLLSGTRKTIPWSFFIPTVTNVLLDALAGSPEGSWPQAVVARRAFDVPPGVQTRMDFPGRSVLGEILLRGGGIPRGKRIWNNRGLRTLLCQAAMDDAFPEEVRVGLLREILLGIGRQDPGPYGTFSIDVQWQHSGEAWQWLARNGADFTPAERHPGEIWRAPWNLPIVSIGSSAEQSTLMEDALNHLRNLHFSGKGLPPAPPVLRFLETHPEFLGLSAWTRSGCRIGDLAAPFIPETVYRAASEEGYLDKPDPCTGKSVHEALALHSTLPLDPVRLKNDRRLLAMAVANPGRSFSLKDPDLMAREVHHQGFSGLSAYGARMKALTRQILQPEGCDNSTDPGPVLMEAVREACSPEVEAAYRRRASCAGRLTPLEILVGEVLPGLRSAWHRYPKAPGTPVAEKILEEAARLLAEEDILGFPVRIPNPSGRNADQPEGDVKNTPARNLADFLAGTLFVECPQVGALWLSSIRSSAVLDTLLAGLRDPSYSPGSLRRVNFSAVQALVRGLSGRAEPDHEFLEGWLADRARDARAKEAMRTDPGFSDDPEPFL